MAHRSHIQDVVPDHVFALTLDALLRFDPRVDERYEQERGAERVKALNHLTLVGLLFYNVYNFTDMILLPDVRVFGAVLRLAAFTPGTMVLYWAVQKVGPRAREWLVMAGMANAFTLPVLLFWMTGAPLGGYSFAELSLTLVYGNMLLALRFRHAVVFTATCLVVAATAVLTKEGLESGLREAFLIQIATGCTFSLYANYRIEAVRCRAYLKELGSVLRVEAAEATSSRLRSLSLTDALTGLPNRRSLEATVGRCSENGDGMTIMMIDVDHFKQFNDTFGHPAGDACLRVIAQTLSAAARSEGAVARFGGEEFALVACALDASDATRIADRLVTSVRALGMSHPARPDGLGCATISVGIAPCPAGTDPATAFAAADAALYLAKRGGRDRSVFAAPDEGEPASRLSA